MSACILRQGAARGPLPEARHGVDQPVPVARERDRAPRRRSPPWNPRSTIVGVRLGEELGLARTGVSVARVPPGRESFVYHAHHHEEEWLYILSGCGVAEVDGRELAVGPGDFLAFPTPSVAHHLRNPFDYDLVYLMGGEHRECEIADFPRLGKRTVRSGAEVTVYDLAAGQPLASPEADAAEVEDAGVPTAGRDPA
ncbi:MAG: cupin domain-containing protein [Halofilum sp. (in: g-proteobacteria)]|nr:cupin domain-containing protein [Halofilum sp. (in: g-proteobacteria)]